MTLYTVRPINGWTGDRTPAKARRSRWTFRAGYGDTIELLRTELEHLRATGTVLQIDVRDQDLRVDGTLRANARQPVDPGVRLIFDTRDHGSLTYQADNCQLWQHNVRSIALGLEALRAVDRYGITQHGQQYKGYRELVAGSGPTSKDDALRVLRNWAGPGFSTAEPSESMWRSARANAHPDRSGMSGPFTAVDQAARTLGLLS